MAAWPESKGESLHTSTFLGNPLACAAALASLKEMEEVIVPGEIQKKGERLLQRLTMGLSGNKAIREIRGIGLMLGIEFSPESSIQAQTLSDCLLKRGLITLPSGPRGEVLALSPPLIIQQEVFDWTVEVFKEELSM